MLEENAPPGTRISSYGWMSLLSHFATAGSLGSAVTLAEDLSGKSVPGIPWPSGTPDAIKDQFKQYVESYNPAREVKVDDYTSGEKGDAEAYERFTAIIRDSRDPFTLNRSWELKPFEFVKPLTRRAAQHKRATH